MKLKLINEQNELLQVFRQASALLKDRHTTLRRPTATIQNGRRHGTLDGYLKPALGRKNLHVLLRTQAVSVSSFLINTKPPPPPTFWIHLMWSHCFYNYCLIHFTDPFCKQHSVVSLHSTKPSRVEQHIRE